MTPSWRAIVIMGVSGCGKTTVGRLVAERLGARFLDGDDVHPAANRAKMACGQALNDADRAPWLARLRQLIDESIEHRTDDAPRLVLACSALKASYRTVLGTERATLGLVWLRAERACLAQRLAARQNHFFPITLLDSQLATLEPPTEALILDAAQPPEAIVAAILAPPSWPPSRRN